MKKYTQTSFNALPIVRGVRQCPEGDYTGIRVFDGKCNFADGCYFGKNSQFNGECDFGRWCQFKEKSSFNESCGFGSRCYFGKECSFSDFCQFGDLCFFGESCKVGEGCFFGGWCSFKKSCKFGDRCSFHEGSVFEESCRFGKNSKFGWDCSFKPSCTFEKKYKALPGHPVLSFGGGGSSNRTLYAFNVEKGPLIRAGCYIGTLEEFRAKVRKDNDPLKSLQYLGFANIVAATWCPKRIEK